MDRLVVTGALGTLGRYTVAELADDYGIVGIDYRELGREPRHGWRDAETADAGGVEP